MLIDIDIDRDRHLRRIRPVHIIQHVFLITTRAGSAPASIFICFIQSLAQRRQDVHLSAVREALSRNHFKVIELATGQLFIGIVLLNFRLDAIVHGHKTVLISRLARIIVGLEQLRSLAESLFVTAIKPPSFSYSIPILFNSESKPDTLMLFYCLFINKLCKGNIDKSQANGAEINKLFIILPPKLFPGDDFIQISIDVLILQ